MTSFRTDQTLPQSFIAEITIFHPDLPLTPSLRELSETSIQVESQPPAPTESPRIFYSVTSPDFDGFEDALSTDRTVDDWKVFMEFSECRVYQIHHNECTKFTTQKAADLGISVVDLQNTGRRWLLQLQTSDKEALGAYWKFCREEDIDFSLQRLYQSGAPAPENEGFKEQLTDRQREVARTVTRMGYFDQEGATAEEVAAELGITSSTLSTHLRRITATVFEYIFDDEQYR